MIVFWPRLLLFMTASLAACGDPRPASELPAVPSTERVIVQPLSLQLRAGQSRQLLAQANGPAGNAIGGAELQYQSLSPGVVTVTASGMVTAVGPSGDAQVAVTSGSARALTNISVSASDPERLAPKAGMDQQGMVAELLAEPVEVLVSDGRGNPVRGAVVDFELTSGGGQVDPARLVSDAAGSVRTLWTLGPRAGRQLLTARVEGVPELSLAIPALAKAGPASAVNSMVNLSQATAGVETELRVQVTDAQKNPVAGADLLWTTSSGQLLNTVAKSSSDGLSVARWKPASAGSSEISVALAGTSLRTSWLVGVTPGPPAKIVALVGQEQKGRARSAVRTAPSLRVEDSQGNPVANAPVHFRVAQGGGSISSDPVLTTSEGIATAPRWSLGASGPQVLEALVADLPTPLSFSVELPASNK